MSKSRLILNEVEETDDYTGRPVRKIRRTVRRTWTSSEEITIVISENAKDDEILEAVQNQPDDKWVRLEASESDYHIIQ